MATDAFAFAMATALADTAKQQRHVYGLAHSVVRATTSAIAVQLSACGVHTGTAEEAATRYVAGGYPSLRDALAEVQKAA